MNVRNMGSSLVGRIIIENIAMHKISGDLPPWLIWKGSDVWLIQLAIRSGAQLTRAEGEHDGRLKLSVKAPPIEGRANQTIILTIANALGLPKNNVRLVSGLKSKRKSVLIEAPADNASLIIETLIRIGH
jgi:uncharacterized protein (TIGR00251 family)